MLPSIAPYQLNPGKTYPNRTTWDPDPTRAVILIHDMQKHFVNAFSDGTPNQLSTAINNIQKLKHHAQTHHIPVIYTAQPPQQSPADRQLLTDFWGPGVQDPESAHIIDELSPDPHDTVLTKWRYCAFYRTDLEDRMRNHHKNQLWITGIYSHIGCLTTALSAFMHGFQVFFIADAQADFSQTYHEQALEYVSSRCGQVVTTSQLLSHPLHATGSTQ